MEKIPTRSGLQREAGSAGVRRVDPAVRAPYTFGPVPIEGRTDRLTYRAKGLTFRVGADEDPDAAAGGYQMRRQGGEIARERSPPER